MTVVGKGILITAGAIFAGLVAYKVMKKRKPELIDKGRQAVSDAREKTSEIIDGAMESFREGYAKA